LFYLIFLIPFLASCASAPASGDKQQAAANVQETAVLPCWRSESCRVNSYPESEWYLGFAEDTLSHKTNAAEFRSLLEQQARGKIAESIRMDVSSRTEIETKSELRSSGGLSAENAGEKAFRSAIPDVWAKIKVQILGDL